ncbi:class I SAM-dependent methyltransferase [Chryseobacterium sp. PBS4-4]|uniref:Class I SAM-dependent methyltransferase n=1 Tax=Chryseobacterium edaphi TaxID=2976532 RepID=A0ABT2WAP6_9FLAO|nr:class I SAM-dependent methyltransferase [Chryseobacterium edaphi]MCU7618347.1 class I SAM-dependent methyltransferase [Chryseobacterium edaphi]
MECKICKQPSHKIFEKTVLVKYLVDYHQCSNCGFIQTDDPFWLKEAYENAITSLDIGILNRNDFLKENVSKMIDCLFPEAQFFLDFAGGYGLFVRAMRDKGYNFYRQDIYCENLFSKHFDIEDLNESNFDLVTAFEVFEHLENPLLEIENILKYSKHLIFSTDIIPQTVSEVENWVYIAAETGQHIAFYSERSLQIVAQKFSKNYYRKGNLHIFTNKTFSQVQVDVALNDKTEYSYFFGLIKKKIGTNYPQRESYQHRDYLKIKEILNEEAANQS